MENSNRPIQRVTPIRSDKIEVALNCSSSSLCSFNQNTKGIDCNAITNSNVIESIPIVQQNVNIMNINLPNNAVIHNTQDNSGSLQNSGFVQSSSNAKTIFQLADGRYVQIAQPPTQQMPATILVQMPYKLVDQNISSASTNFNNKKYIIQSKGLENPSVIMNNVIVTNQQQPQCIDGAAIKFIDSHNQSLTNNPKVGVNQNSTGVMSNSSKTIIPLDKYQEISDMLHSKKLLTKLTSNEETVLVEFRLNQQKYQFRMTRIQKIEMEKLLISVGNQQRQMEILQVYQAEQRKMMPQKTSVVLNHMISKNASNIVCNSPNIQNLNVNKPIYPINSVLLAVPQNHFTDVVQSNSVNQQKAISLNTSVSHTSSNGVILNARLSTPQSSILSSSSIMKDPNRDPVLLQKRNVKLPISVSNQSSTRDYLPNANSNNEMKPARSRRYNNMRKVLFDDHNAVILPDCNRPFDDLKDVSKRLLPYHVLEESKDQNSGEVDRLLHSSFMSLDKRLENLKRLVSSICLKETLDGQRNNSFIVKRMRLDLERDVFENEKKSYLNSISDDENHRHANNNSLSMNPLKFDDHGNGIYIDLDMISDDNINNKDDDSLSDILLDLQEKSVTDTNNPDESHHQSHHYPVPVLCADGTETNDTSMDSSTSDNLLDTLCNYNIQDISLDSIDSNFDGIDWSGCQDKDNNCSTVDNATRPTATDNGRSVEGHPQSEDPDLDAAIKSILF